MTGLERSSAGLDDRRKRNLYRAWHRGTKEMDLLLGPFAEAELAAMSEDELEQFEVLLELPDQDFYTYLTGAKPVPETAHNAVYDKLLAFHAGLGRGE